jgi:hypothetical protein
LQYETAGMSHPSFRTYWSLRTRCGDVTPSEADIRLTHKLQQAGELLLIPLLDHIIFTDKGKTFFSFMDNETLSSIQSQGRKESEVRST